MIVKASSTLATQSIAVTREETRERLIELWAQVFERELRADFDAETVPSRNAQNRLADAKLGRRLGTDQNCDRGA